MFNQTRALGNLIFSFAGTRVNYFLPVICDYSAASLPFLLLRLLTTFCRNRFSLNSFSTRALAAFSYVIVTLRSVYLDRNN